MTGTGDPQDLSGIEIGDYVLKRKVGEGAFASVFEGGNKYSGVCRAFKIARKWNGRTGPTELDWWTKALIDMTGLIARARPDTNVLLRKQFAALELAGEPVYPKVDGLLDCNGTLAIQMEFLEGSTLRELMAKGTAREKLLLKITRLLIRLEQMGQVHGDLKPENIFVAGDRVVLLDPGFYGEIQLVDGSRGAVTVTTPAYYPLRRPDDMMAFGLILVEIVTGVNPLWVRADAELGLLSGGLAERLSQLHLGNNYFFDSICRLSRRTALGEKLARSPLRSIISQALGLTFGPELGEGPRYPDWAALEADLKNVVAAGQVFGWTAGPEV